jgi:hypothetical protein
MQVGPTLARAALAVCVLVLVAAPLGLRWLRRGARVT